MTESGERIEIYYNRGKALGGVIFSIVFIAGGLFAALKGETWKPILCGWAAVIAGPLLLVFMLKRMRKVPILVLDERGVTDLSRKTEFFIPWTGLKDVRLKTVGKATMLTLVPADLEAYKGTVSPAAQKMGGLNVEGPTFIDMEIPSEQLEQLIRRKQAKHAPSPPVMANYPRP